MSDMRTEQQILVALAEVDSALEMARDLEHNTERLERKRARLLAELRDLRTAKREAKAVAL